MSPVLKKYRFHETDLELPEVQGFTCGPNRWDEEVAAWIKSRSGDNSVLEDIKRVGVHRVSSSLFLPDAAGRWQHP